MKRKFVEKCTRTLIVCLSTFTRLLNPSHAHIKNQTFVKENIVFGRYKQQNLSCKYWEKKTTFQLKFLDNKKKCVLLSNIMYIHLDYLLIKWSQELKKTIYTRGREPSYFSSISNYASFVVLFFFFKFKDFSVKTHMHCIF